MTDAQAKSEPVKMCVHVVFPGARVLFRIASPCSVLKDADELQINMKPTTPFSKLYDAVATQRGINVKAFRLTYDGERLNGEHNPKMVRMSLSRSECY
jgi:hypothetical protein